MKNTDTLQTRGVTKVPVFIDSQADIRRKEHLELRPGQPLARWINLSVRTLQEAGIETENHWPPVNTGIPGNEKADRKANLAREGRRSDTTRELGYRTSAANRKRRISETKTAAKAQCEADRCSKHHGYRLKGKPGRKRTIPLNGAKSLTARFYRLKSGQAPVATYLKLLGHTHLRQPHSTPGLAKLSPHLGGSAVLLWLHSIPFVCVHLLLQLYVIVLKLSLPLSIDINR